MASPEPSHAQVVVAPPLVFVAAILIGFVANLLVPVELLPFMAQLCFGLPIIGFSIFLSVVSFRSFAKSGTPASHRARTIVLVTSGPYGYSRNPLYLSGLLLILGFGLLLDSIWILMVLPLAVVIVHYGAVRREEAYLLSRFGEEYQQYMRSVRRWI